MCCGVLVTSVVAHPDVEAQVVKHKGQVLVSLDVADPDIGAHQQAVVQVDCLAVSGTFSWRDAVQGQDVVVLGTHQVVLDLYPKQAAHVMDGNRGAETLLERGVVLAERVVDEPLQQRYYGLRHQLQEESHHGLEVNEQNDHIVRDREAVEYHICNTSRLCCYVGV